ncbi:MAG: hypothetical protein R2827_06135 [Bdellovibrionales bacterium]
MDGIKIGIFGITGAIHDSTDSVFTGPFYNGMKMNLDFVGVAKRQVAELKQQKVDYIILLSHLGTYRDKIVAENVSGIDYIIGGHSHKVYFYPRKFNGVSLVETGWKANHVGELTLAFDKNSKKLYGTSYALYPVHPWIFGVDQEFNQHVANTINEYEESSDSPICQVQKKLDKAQFIKKFTDLLMQELGSDVVLLNESKFDQGLKKGSQTVQNLFDVLSPQIQPPATTGIASLYTMIISKSNFESIQSYANKNKKVYLEVSPPLSDTQELTLVGHKEYLLNLPHYFGFESKNKPKFLGETWVVIRDLCQNSKL